MKEKGWGNSEEEVADSDDNIEIPKAKEIQLKNWVKHNKTVLKTVSKAKVVSVWRVIIKKFKDKDIIYKARLVVRGFEEKNWGASEKIS